MLWYMNSKDMEMFLENETDDDILDAQYVIVSNRIRRVGTAHNNIIQANVLFPDPSTLSLIMENEEDVFLKAYYKQLDQNKTLLACLIKASIVKNMNIIFLCTKKEDKLSNYLKHLSRYVYNEFDYPMYRYKDFAEGKVKEVKYDEPSVYAKCKKLIKSAKEQDVINKISGEKKLSNNNKKYLKKILKTHGLYEKGMSENEMRNLAEIYMWKGMTDE